MKGTWILGFAAAAIALLVALRLYAIDAEAQRSTGTLPPAVLAECGQLNTVPSPNIGTDSNLLQGVSALSSNNVWAVGYAGNPAQTLIEHWNGTVWSVVPSLNPTPATTICKVYQHCQTGMYGPSDTMPVLVPAPMRHWSSTGTAAHGR